MILTRFVFLWLWTLSMLQLFLVLYIYLCARYTVAQTYVPLFSYNYDYHCVSEILLPKHVSLFSYNYVYICVPAIMLPKHLFRCFHKTMFISVCPRYYCPNICFVVFILLCLSLCVGGNVVQAWFFPTYVYIFLGHTVVPILLVLYECLRGSNILSSKPVFLLYVHLCVVLCPVCCLVSPNLHACCTFVMNSILSTTKRMCNIHVLNRHILLMANLKLVNCPAIYYRSLLASTCMLLWCANIFTI